MSSSIETAKRRSALLLATYSILSLGVSLAAQQTPPTALPPVEVNPPTDPNKTRARPPDDEAATLTPRRAYRTSSTPRPHGRPTPQPVAS